MSKILIIAEQLEVHPDAIWGGRHEPDARVDEAVVGQAIGRIADRRLHQQPLSGPTAAKPLGRAGKVDSLELVATEAIQHEQRVEPCAPGAFGAHRLPEPALARVPGLLPVRRLPSGAARVRLQGGSG